MFICNDCWSAIGYKMYMWAVWAEKIRQMSIKVAQNDFTRKMTDFDTFTKIA